MAGNSTLKKAAQAKQDEFYTQLEDIENELKHYKEHFRNKTIFCNCDDPFESNFFKYFAMNFQHLGIKKLIATCYVSSPLSYTQLALFDDLEYEVKVPQSRNQKPYKVEITEVEDLTGNGAIDLDDIKLLLKNNKNVCTVLKGDGDFRSDECIELLKEADIVVTNPPFSLFREFLGQLEEMNKDFIIIGNTNALTYKEVFTLFKNDRIRTGYTKFNVGMFFEVPEYYEKYTKIVDGKKYARVSTSCWFTSLPVNRHKENLILYKTYSEEEYPKYDNYDAINVDSFKDIPCDYYGTMGVPITFLDKYNPEQFELIGMAHGDMGQALGVSANFSEEKCNEYLRKNKAFRRGFVCYTDKDSKLIVPYMRILIRRKEHKT